MERTNHFINPPEEYRRDLDQIGVAIRESASYIHKQTGRPYDECLAYVKSVTAPGGKFALNDPEVMCLSKDTQGNREPKIMTLRGYLRDVDQRQAILSPTMCAYLNPAEKESLLGIFTTENIGRRKTAKHAMFAAERAGDKVAEAFHDIVQSTYKIDNNSLSGAHASAFTPLYNKSSHSSLTSTCRCASGPANANNERFAAGNRHYYNPEVAKANIISVINRSDYSAIEKVMSRLNIHYPTTAEVCAAIKRSTDLYWEDDSETAIIDQLIANLTALERAAYLYSQDLYHLRVYNDKLVRDFIGRLATRATAPIDDPETWVKSMDDDTKAFVSLLCGDEFKKLENKTLPECKKHNPNGYALIGATAKNVFDTLDEYSDLIRAFWVTANVPAAVAAFPSSIRRVALVSDTDSTIFTVQDWTTWYVGYNAVDAMSRAVSAAVTYLVTQTTIHLLAIVSGNMGVIDERKYQLAMKNEYEFPVFGLTSMGKHYYAYMGAREGSVFDKPKLELKGVNLRNSNTPKGIRDQGEKLICSTMDKIMAGEKLNAAALLKQVADIEREIINSVRGGSSKFLSRMKVNARETYSEPIMSKPYQYYDLWETVFAPKYGSTSPPPYVAVKATLDTHNKTAMAEWLDGMSDQELAERMRRWLKTNNKDKITLIAMPMDVIAQNGLPEEVISGMKLRKLVHSIMSMFYDILESYGLFYSNKDNTKLVSDEH